MSINPLPQQADYEGLRNYIRAWMARFYPGIPFEYAQIFSTKLPIPINIVEHPAIGVPFPHMAASTTPPLPEPSSNGQAKEEGRDKKSGLDESTKAILHVLRKSKKPLTKTMMLEALEEAQRKGEINEYVSISESTVCRRLKELMDDGTLQNPEDVKPRGYRFSE